MKKIIIFVCSFLLLHCSKEVKISEKELLKQKGVVICLFASAESIIERTSRNKNRPLLNVDDPAAKIRELLKEREPIYMDSGACITTEDRTVAEVVRHMTRTYKASERYFPK